MKKTVAVACGIRIHIRPLPVAHQIHVHVKRRHIHIRRIGIRDVQVIRGTVIEKVVAHCKRTRRNQHHARRRVRRGQ